MERGVSSKFCKTKRNKQNDETRRRKRRRKLYGREGR